MGFRFLLACFFSLRPPGASRLAPKPAPTRPNFADTGNVIRHSAILERMMIGTRSLLAASLIAALTPAVQSFVVPTAPHHVQSTSSAATARPPMPPPATCAAEPKLSCAGSRPPVRADTSLALVDGGIVEQFTDPVLLEHIATGGALALAGDVIAQSLLSEVRPRSFPPKDWDTVRTAAFVAFGGIYTGGVQHFIFGFLNATFDEALVRLALAQFFFIPFCYYPTFLLMVPSLRAGWESEGGFGSEEAKLRRDQLFSETFSKIPSTLQRNWLFWLPVQFVQFNFVPVDLQVTYCAAFGVIWNAILSWSTSSSASTAEKNA